MQHRPLFRHPLSVALLGAAAAVWLACGSSNSRECNVGADCASGACNADGTCVPTTTGGKDGGADGMTLADGEAPGDEAGGGGEGGNPGVDSGACAPNHDGTIDSAEVPLGPGLEAKFRIATNETIDTAGKDLGNGTRAWDFSGALASDQDVIVQTLSPTGTWWSKDFPKATYATKLAQGQDFLGVFQTGTDALLLTGVVSSTSDNISETELTYDTPVPTLKFPFTMGTAWTTTSNATGLYNGVVSTHSEKYESKVDASGTVKTPFATFPVLRVSTVLTQTVGALVTVTRTFTWVTECYGVVAKATSTSNETQAEFTQAAELQRITP